MSECDDVCKVSSCDLQADKAVTSETDLVDNHEERAWVLYMIHCISHGMCNNVPLLPLCLDAAKKNNVTSTFVINTTKAQSRNKDMTQKQ